VTDNLTLSGQSGLLKYDMTILLLSVSNNNDCSVSIVLVPSYSVCLSVSLRNVHKIKSHMVKSCSNLTKFEMIITMTIGIYVSQ
jgi:hypothetical protein